ncbi:MAG: YqiA/YcfP family alpha/beta fold hydrolase [Rhizobacter sp.]
MTITHVLYLHGFRSSPHSAKAQQMADWMRGHAPRLTWWCPQLPPSPCDAIDLLTQGAAAWPMERTAIVGSSLGGFYATVLAERWGCKAGLLNPAIHPARDLAKHLGETTAWHSAEPFFFVPEYLNQLRDMAPAELTRLSVISR